MAIGQFGDQCLVLNTAQATSGAAAQLVAQNASRRSVVITNLDATNGVGIGTSSSLTTSNGYVLPAGQSISFGFYVGPIWFIAQAGTPKVAYCEESK